MEKTSNCYRMRTIRHKAKNNVLTHEDKEEYRRLFFEHLATFSTLPEDSSDIDKFLQAELSSIRGYRWAVEAAEIAKRSGIGITLTTMGWEGHDDASLARYRFDILKIQKNIYNRRVKGLSPNYAYTIRAAGTIRTREVTVTADSVTVAFSSTAHRPVTPKKDAPSVSEAVISRLTDGQLIRMVRDGNSVDAVWREARRRKWDRQSMISVFEGGNGE